jgi:hypothetical protein
MSDRLHIKPAWLVAIIRDPHTKRALAPEGGRVPDTSFYRRRLASGDAVMVEVQPAAEAEKAKTHAPIPARQNGE